MKKNLPVRSNQHGQSLIEYIAITALVAIVSIGAVKTFGSKVRTRLSQVTTSFDRNIQQGLKARPSSSYDDFETSPARSRKRMQFPGLLVDQDQNESTNEE